MAEYRAELDRGELPVSFSSVRDGLLAGGERPEGPAAAGAGR